MAMSTVTVSRVRNTDGDPLGLGRWSSIQIEGSKGHYTRHVNGYVPCANKKGSLTVHSQQKEYFRQQGTDREPIQAMQEDFKEALIEWCEAGETIVIRMDANQDVRNGSFALMLQSHGFQEQISFRHGHLEPPPGTQVDNMRGIPIDGIWTNFAHGQLQCGHLAFDASFPTDHHLNWI